MILGNNLEEISLSRLGIKLRNLPVSKWLNWVFYCFFKMNHTYTFYGWRVQMSGWSNLGGEWRVKMSDWNEPWGWLKSAHVRLVEPWRWMKSSNVRLEWTQGVTEEWKYQAGMIALFHPLGGDCRVRRSGWVNPGGDWRVRISDWNEPWVTEECECQTINLNRKWLLFYWGNPVSIGRLVLECHSPSGRNLRRIGVFCCLENR